VKRSPSASPPPATPDAVAPAAARRRRRQRALRVTGRIAVPAEIQKWERELLMPLVVRVIAEMAREHDHE